MIKLIIFCLGIFFFTQSCYNQKVIKGKRISSNNDYAIRVLDTKTPNHVILEVREGDIASNGGRSEIMAEKSGFEEEYSFSFKIHKYKYESSKHFILADWHHDTRLHRLAETKGEQLYSPIVIHLIGDNIVLANRAGRFVGNVGNLQLDSNFTMNLLREPINYNKWNTVYVKIKWSDSNHGAIFANVNGKAYVFKDIRTTYDMAYPNFYKVGIYRNLTYQSDAIIEFKDLKIGKSILVPDFSRKLTGEKNNNQEIIKKVRNKYIN